MLLALVVLSSNALGTWILIWGDNFDSGCPNWTLGTAAWTCNAQHLAFAPAGGALGSWQGATYRSAAGSKWDITAYNEVRVEYNWLRPGVPGINDNQQLTLRFENGHNTPDSGTGNDFFEVRLTGVQSPADFSWKILNRDDGSTTEVISYPIANPQGRDMYSNITVNIQAIRFWINFTTYDSGTFNNPVTGAITGQWNNSVDGWYAESTTYDLNFWGLKGNSGGASAFVFDAINVYGLSVPTFSVATNPGSVTAAAGGSGTLTTFVNGSNGWAGAVTLSLSNAPAGVTGSCPTPVTPDGSCTFTVSVGSNAAPGTYNVTLQGSGNGTTNSTTFILRVTASAVGSSGRKIVADFYWRETSLGVQFYDRSQAIGAVVAWEWTFADGYGSKRQNPFHPFPCAGDYFVGLTVADEFGDRDNTSNWIHIQNSSVFCGVLQRTEQGVSLNTPSTGRLWFPAALFIFLAVVSAVTLILGIDPKIRGQVVVSRAVRVGLVIISAVFLALEYGDLAPILR